MSDLTDEVYVAHFKKEATLRTKDYNDSPSTEPLDIVKRTCWSSDYAAETCLLCATGGEYIGGSWEMTFEWGDTKICIFQRNM